MSFLQSILAPYIEGYWCVAVQLSMLWEQQQNMEMLHKGTVNNGCVKQLEWALLCVENSFLHELQLSMIERCQQGTLLHGMLILNKLTFTYSLSLSLSLSQWKVVQWTYYVMLYVLI